MLCDFHFDNFTSIWKKCKVFRFWLHHCVSKDKALTSGKNYRSVWTPYINQCVLHSNDGGCHMLLSAVLLLFDIQDKNICIFHYHAYVFFIKQNWNIILADFKVKTVVYIFTYWLYLNELTRAVVYLLTIWHDSVVIDVDMLILHPFNYLIFSIK